MDRTDTHIEDRTRARFTVIPNCIDDMDLSVYAFRLYCHIKRVAGDSGLCWQSTDTLAAACKMSAGSVVNAKKELEEAGLIEIELASENGKTYHNIAVIDVWDRNQANPSQSEPDRSPHERYRSPHEPDRSPGETIKIPIKNIPINNIPREEEEGKSEIVYPVPEESLRAAPAAPEPINTSPSIFCSDVYATVTGMFAIPGKMADKRDAMEALLNVQMRYPDKKTMVEYLNQFYDAWIARGYNKINHGWLTDWAIAGEMPASKKQRGESKLILSPEDVVEERFSYVGRI